MVIKSALLSVIAALGLTAAAPKPSPLANIVPGTIVLDKDTLILNTEINDETVAPLINQIFTSPKSEMTMYIRSPGGSIDSGNALIQAMNSSGKTFTCVAEEAISMAFVTLQLGCTKRVVLENSTLMQHLASYGLPSQPAANQHNLVRFVEKLIDSIERKQAKRMQLSIEKFRENTSHDWWMFAEEGVENKAADVLGNAVCTPELAKATHIEERHVFIFVFQGRVSNCPLVNNFTIIPPENAVAPAPTPKAGK